MIFIINKELSHEFINEYCDKIIEETFNQFFSNETNDKLQPEEIFLTD